MANPHVLQAPLEILFGKWGAMGKESGYRRDYRGIRRFAYDLPIEDDEVVPWVQVDLGDSEQTRDESSSRIFLTQEVYAQVHVFAEDTADGDKDMTTPLLAVQADIHQAAFDDRNLGNNFLWVDFDRHEVAPFGGPQGIGTTLRAVYNINYWFNAADMSDAPV